MKDKTFPSSNVGHFVGPHFCTDCTWCMCTLHFSLISMSYFLFLLQKNTKLAELMSQTQHCMMLHVVKSFCTKLETGLTVSYSMCKQTQQILGVVGLQCCVHLHVALQLYF